MANFDISNLGSYVLNNSKKYALASVASAKTAKELISSGNAQYGVKGQASVLKIDSGVSLVDNTGGSRSAGTTITYPTRTSQ